MFDDELGTENQKEVTLSVIYNNTNYSVKKKIVNESENTFKDLIDELVKKIIFEMGIMCIKNSFNKENYTILHRGNCKEFQENSIKALEDACSKYDGFETDIRLTKDDYW